MSGALIAAECDTVTIDLEGSCGASEHCEILAARLYAQLHRGYRFPAAVMELPDSLDDHLAAHRTFRKRAQRARNLGYRFDRIERHLYEDDVFAINTSKPERQGRPMADGYLQPVSFAPLPHYPCDRHAIRTYGVLKDDVLVAYTWVYRAGDMVMFSTILGHADHMPNDVMYLLMAGVLEQERGHGPGVCFYNLMNSGTDGLRYFKEKVGFRAVKAEWLP